MDYFGEQDRARKQSNLFLVIFLVVLLGFAFVVNGVASVAAYWLGQSDSLWSMNQFSLSITGSLCLIVLIGCWLRYRDVRDGGVKLATRFGGTQLVSTATTHAERTLLNVVAEMSLAASIPAPHVFCLKHESSINAFVVGSDEDFALVVSQGALDNLDRDQLLGVVGHEFGHLANGDLAHNMRMLVALGGLNALDEAGKHLNRLALTHIPGSKNTLLGQNRDRSYLALPLLFAGIPLRILGSIGVLAGTVVRSSFSRQRELLADASSVQFTRSTFGLASALNSISETQRGPALHSKYSGELAHLCFQVPVSSFSLVRVFDTHPPISNRITAIDRNYSVKARNRKARSDAHSERAAAIAQAAMEEKEWQASTLYQRLSRCVSDQVTCQAIIFALFVNEQTTHAENYFGKLNSTHGEEFSDRVKSVHTFLGEEMAAKKPRIIDYLAPQLNALKSGKRSELLHSLEALVNNDSTFENFALLQVIRRKIEDKVTNRAAVTNPENFETLPDSALSISELGEELSLLLSLLIEASGYSGEKVANAHARVLKCYTNETYPLRSVKEEGVTDCMVQAFEKLYQLPHVQRKAFLQHCTEIMLIDNIQMPEEVALINLFAASLDVQELCLAA